MILAHLHRLRVLQSVKAPEFSYIYWEATKGATDTDFYVYCEFDIANADAPNSVTAYVTIDGSTPSTSNNSNTASLSDTSTGNDGSTWDSATALNFSNSSVNTNDVVKVLLVATNDGGSTDSVVVSLTVAVLGNNNTQYIYP